MPLFSRKTRNTSSSSSPARYFASIRSNFSMSASCAGSISSCITGVNATRNPTIPIKFSGFAGGAVLQLEEAVVLEHGEPSHVLLLADLAVGEARLEQLLRRDFAAPARADED